MGWYTTSVTRFSVYTQLSTHVKALFWACVWVIAYFVLLAVLPASNGTMRQYHLSETEFHILAVLTALPATVVWFVAFYGYASLTEYTEKVGTSGEGKSYRSIARGLKWLAWSLPLSACMNAVLGGLASISPGYRSAALIISHYIVLGISLVAFTYMSDGSRGLRDMVRTMPSKSATRGMLALAIMVAVSYCTIILHAVSNQHPNTYRLPLWLILLTIIIPYLYAWLMGFLAVFEISLYGRSVRGLFYKRSLRFFASGTTCVIIASVALQYLTSTSPYLWRIILNWRLITSYVILATFAIGFILIIVGTSRLKKIEEI